MFSENKKEFPFLIPFSAQSCLRPKLPKSTAAPSILGPVAAQHPQLAAHPYPSNHRGKSVEAPQTLPVHLLFHLGPASFSPASARDRAEPIRARTPAVASVHGGHGQGAAADFSWRACLGDLASRAL
jgi:hypothetical protein